MGGYNWDAEYQDFWWIIRHHGYEPEDDNLKRLLEYIFGEGYDLGFDTINEKALEESYDEGYEDGKREYEVDEDAIYDQGYQDAVDGVRSLVVELLDMVPVGNETTDEAQEWLDENL